jgi:hypothetical protein
MFWEPLMGRLGAVRIFFSTMQNGPFVTWSPTPVNGYQGARFWIGYHIQATDGEIGHVEDFFADDQYWTLRYLLVDTRNWLPGRSRMPVKKV